jgi:hypothetical protein
MMRRDPVIIDFEQEPPCRAPIYANKYAMDDVEERRGETRSRPPSYRSQSMPRQQSRFGDRLLPPGRGALDNRSLYNDNGMEMQPKGRAKRERPGKFFVLPFCVVDVKEQKCDKLRKTFVIKSAEDKKRLKMSTE